MIVTKLSFRSALEEIAQSSDMSLDTETTGLMVWKGDALFSVVIGTKKDAYYFNFQTYPELGEDFVLPREWLADIGKLVSDPHKNVYMHNAKFDLGMIAKEGVEVLSKIHDTEVGARLEFNDYETYNLADCSERIGEQKSDAVEEYIKEHKLTESRPIPGKKQRARNKKFYLVPFHIISEYALQDARVTYTLGKHQEKYVQDFDKSSPKNENRASLRSLLECEKALTPVLFKMEKAGVKIDHEYCEQAIEYEDARARGFESRFSELTGFDFKDSNKHLAKVFASLGITFGVTDKGNPSFTDEKLEKIEHEAARLVQAHRDSAKRANTYFRSFLFHADDNNIIHTDLRQSGTKTGRMSCANPNLQNLSKDEEEGLKYTVRRAFVPREDFYFCMIDYNQMEFRMMLDFAEQMDLIKRIRDEGHDPHVATAELTGLSRKAAKTLNFGLLYGMGIEKLSKSLKVPLEDARLFRNKYFAKLPKVQMFLKAAQIRAKNEGQVRDWAGRVFHFPQAKFAYKAPNAIIQGGCADVVKYAMVKLDPFLKDKKSRMLLQIHDELLFEIHKSELGIEVEIQKIMESIYPQVHLPLTCSVSHSFKSWDDKRDGIPLAFESATRDTLQIKSAQGFGNSSETNQASLV